MVMRSLFVGVFVLSLVAAVSAQKFYGTTDVKNFRMGRDAEFRNKTESPLKEEDFAAFKGLNYFPVDKAFRVKAAFKRTADEKYFEMPTSAGKTKRYVKYGELTFTLDGKQQRLNVYQMSKAARAKFPEYADLVFIPFRDATYTTDTYGGGRYIDIKKPKKGKVTLDFNLAYNPSCAYGSDRFNCPIPPRENTLDIAITAGEKRFAYNGQTATH